MQRIQHGPQHVALENERPDRRLLLLRRPGLALDIVESEIRIARRLGQALLEIGENLGRYIVVVLQHARDADTDGFRREHFGQRRGDGFQKRFLPHEMHIGLDGEARGGKDSVERSDIGAIEAEPFGQEQTSGRCRLPDHCRRHDR